MGVRGVSKKQFALEELIDMPPPTREVPAWRLAPTRMERVVNLTPEELLDKIDHYFATTHERGARPTLCDLAGSTGFDSVQHLINHARRKGSATMRGLSRALTAVAAEYEELLQEGHKQAQFILQQIPQFDTDDAPATPPIKTFAPTVQIPVVIAGLARPEDTGNKMSEHEAYLMLIKNKTYQDAEVIDLALNEEGTYSGIDLEKLPED